MANQIYELDTNITPTETNSTSRVFLPPELYLPEWARDTEFFRCMTILLDYLQNSLKDLSNPKYAIVEQAYKDIGFKYKDIMQTSEESLKAMLIENGFGKILEIFNLSLTQLQMLALYLPLLKIMKGTDEGYRLFLSLFASEFEIETWLDNPQELEEYTFNILFISWINVGLSANMVKNFIEFSRSYVYPILKKVEMGVMYKFLSPSVYGRPLINFDISARIEDDFVIGWSLAARDSDLSTGTWNNVASNGTMFVAVSEEGYVSTSSDGVAWSAQQSMGLNVTGWQTITWDGTKFISINTTGDVAISSNGTTWTLLSSSNLITNPVFMAYNGYSYIVSVNPMSRIYRYEGVYGSTDCINWELLADIQSRTTRYSMAYGNNKFVRVFTNGDIQISSNNNADDWDTIFDAIPEVNTSSGLRVAPPIVTSIIWSAAAFDGTKFIAISEEGYTSYSIDGRTWSNPEQIENLGEHNWYSTAYDGAKTLLALSNDGYTSVKFSPAITETT